MTLSLTLATSLPAAPPNVLFVVGDDQGWRDYGFMGHPAIQTPHLDKLAGQSVRFPRGYVPTSLCRASLATMITGLYPHQHLITSNDPPLPAGVKAAAAMKHPDYLRQRAEMVDLFAKSETLAERLGKVGYVSFQAGKWWEGNACRCGGFTDGMTHGDPAKGGRHGDLGLTVGRQVLKPVTDFIDAAKADGKPFFVWYAPMMPHTPHTPPQRLLDKYTGKTPSPFVAKYWAMCEWFDETVGDLLGHLDRTGLAGNTLVVYLHDNGWIQDPDRDGFAPKSKRSQYDGGTRTPILVRLPGRMKPGTCDTPVNSIDLVPTALRAAGLTPPVELPGIDLLDPAAVAARPAVFGEIFEHNAVDIRRPAANLQYRWVVRGHWKLIVPHAPLVKDGTVELYDLAADPDETRNLADKQPDTAAELRKLLDGWWDGK